MSVDNQKGIFERFAFVFYPLILISVVLAAYLLGNVKKYDEQLSTDIASYVCLVIAISSISYGVVNLVLQHLALNWPEQTCKIIDKKMTSYSLMGAKMIKPLIYFEYSYFNKVFVSNKVTKSLAYFSDHEKAQNIYNKYEINNHNKCFINPNNPKQAVLEKNVQYKYFFSSLFIFFLFIFIFMKGQNYL